MDKAMRSKPTKVDGPHRASIASTWIGAIRVGAVIGCMAAGWGDGTARAVQGDTPPFDADSVVGLLELVIETDAESARRCLSILNDKILSHEVGGPKLAAIRDRLRPPLRAPLGDSEHALHREAVILAGSWGDADALARLAGWVRDERRSDLDRGDAIGVLLAAGAPGALGLSNELLIGENTPRAVRARVLDELARSTDREVAPIVLGAWDRLGPEFRPRAMELLTQRPVWARHLLATMEANGLAGNALPGNALPGNALPGNVLPGNVLNVNQLLRLQASGDQEVVAAVQRLFGTVRATRNPDRDAVIREVRDVVLAKTGDPRRGWDVFRRTCGPCHRIHGEGEEVGPDITRNGRASLTQLLSNVLDPSLVIGASYQAQVVVTRDGRIITGLVVEKGPRRTVLKLQGGKTEVIPADEIESAQMSPLSLMPEGLEKQLESGELLDLFTFLRLDKSPLDPTATFLPDDGP